jgi:hypothetical protein
MLNVSERSVRTAAKVKKEAAPEVIQQIKEGKKSLHAAASERKPKEKPQSKPRKKTIAKASEAESGRSITVKLDRFDSVTVRFPLPEDYIEASQYVMEAFGVSDNPDRLKEIAKDLVAFGKELQEFAAWLDRIFD